MSEFREANEDDYKAWEAAVDELSPEDREGCHLDELLYGSAFIDRATKKRVPALEVLYPPTTPEEPGNGRRNKLAPG